MKRILFAAVVALAIIGLIAWYFESRLIEGFTVGRYSYAASTNGSPAIADTVILEGIQQSLLQSKLNPDAWVVSPSSAWQPTNGSFKSVQAPISILITLSNQVDQTQLYVRVTTAAVSNNLDYHLYRPK